MTTAQITILAVILLASCDRPITDGDVVAKIDGVTNGVTTYTARFSADDGFVDKEFVAPSGLYNIGDTIHFVKR